VNKSRFKLVIVGLVSLFWLLFRTGAKPSRVNYPCQRAARFNATLVFVPMSVLLAVSNVGKLLEKNGERIFLLLLLSSFAFNFVVTPWNTHAEVDVDADGKVDVNDLRFLGKAFGSSSGGVGWNSTCDLNYDGFVDELDLRIFAQYYGFPFAVNSTVFVIRANYTGNGGNLYPAMSTLFDMMKLRSQDVYNLIRATDVVVIKVNSKWAYAGGTNTDLVNAFMQKIVEHPQGWSGEVVIADNGQGTGSFNWVESNSFDHTQPMLDVATHFAGLGYKVSVSEWQNINQVVSEFEDGDYNSGYVEVAPYYEDRPTSYPKFQTSFGTYVSLSKGVWNGSAYNRSKLKIVNMPVLKSHSDYGVTSVVKNYMGVVSQPLSNTHYYVQYGAMGDIMHLAYPTLNIVDAIYVNPIPWDGPSTPYSKAVLADTIVVGTDPIATDYVASKRVLMPTAEASGFNSSSMDPDRDVRGQWNWGYRQYLVSSYNKLVGYGHAVTMDQKHITIVPG